MAERATDAAKIVRRYNQGEKGDQELTPTHVRFRSGTAKGRWLDLNDPSSIDAYHEKHPRLNGYIEIKTEEGIIFGISKSWNLAYTIIMIGKREKSLKIWYP